MELMENTRTQTSEQVVHIISYFGIPLLSSLTRVNGKKRKEVSAHSVQQFTLFTSPTFITIPGSLAEIERL